MPASPFDSAIYRHLMTDAEVATLFTDTAELRAMLLCWGALAQAQGKHGIIPETAAHAIQRAAMEIQIDPGALAAETGANAVPVPALLRIFRDEMQAPEHSAHVHHGATSQDIMDTGLSLRLRQVLTLFEGRIIGLATALGTLARTHAETPMAARTWGQVATPTSFGAVVAGWGRPLLDLRADLEGLRTSCLLVSLSGAGGTGAALGPPDAPVRAAFAEGLGLGDPGQSWHSQRLPRARLAAWLAMLTGALGKMGRDIADMASSSRGELRLAGSGGSSTMPQKQNPVLAELLVALAQTSAHQNASLQAALAHRDQRDGAAWMTEWMTLPQIVFAAGRALTVAQTLAESLQPDVARMAAPLEDDNGLIYAEALTFALAATLPRPEAATRVKALCGEVLAQGGNLRARAKAAFPDHDLTDVFTPDLGHAPAEARRFAEAAVALKPEASA